MVNSFTNDHAYISTKWLMRLIHQQGLPIKHLLWITHLSGGQAHYLVLMGDGQYICDCCMGLNLGIPCRHYFQALMTVPGLRFTIALIQPRSRQHYLSYDNILTSLQMVSEPSARHPASANRGIWHRPGATQSCSHEGATCSFLCRPTHPHLGLRCINPTTGNLNSLCPWSSFQSAIMTSGTDSQCQHLQRLRWPPRLPQSNQVSHLAFMASYKTDTLLCRSQYKQEAHQDGIHDPLIMKSKGRPWTTRLNSQLEGPPWGGGGTQYGIVTRVDRGIRDGGRKCTICRKSGHNQQMCPVYAERGFWSGFSMGEQV